MTTRSQLFTGDKPRFEVPDYALLRKALLEMVEYDDEGNRKSPDYVAMLMPRADGRPMNTDVLLAGAQPAAEAIAEVVLEKTKGVTCPDSVLIEAATRYAGWLNRWPADPPSIVANGWRLSGAGDLIAPFRRRRLRKAVS